MAKLSEVVGALLSSVTRARATADAVSAQLAKRYLEDDTLKFFPVPRVDVEDVTFELRFAVSAPGPDPDVVVEADKLRELDPGKISTAKLVTRVRNYAWVGSDTGKSFLEKD